MRNTFVFYENKKSKVMKSINCKLKNLNRFLYPSKGGPWELQLSRTCLTSTEKTSNTDEKQELVHFFAKTLVEVSKFITNS